MEESKINKRILSSIFATMLCFNHNLINIEAMNYGDRIVEKISEALGRGFFKGMAEGIKEIKLSKDFMGDAIKGIGEGLQDVKLSKDFVGDAIRGFGNAAKYAGAEFGEGAEDALTGAGRGVKEFMDKSGKATAAALRKIRNEIETPQWLKLCFFLLSSSPFLGKILQGYIDLKKIDISQAKYEDKVKQLFSGSNIDYSVPWKKVEDNLKTYMKKSYSNQTQIEKVISWIGSFYIKQQEIDSGKRTKQLGDSSCLLISIDGGPGCGKTQFCREVAKSLGCTRINSIGPGDFDPDHKSLSLRQQAVGAYNTKVGELSILNYGKLVNILKNNRKGVLIVDDLGALPSDVRRILWDMRDYGYVVLNGEVVDCTGTIVLLTSNEGINNVDTSNKLSVASAEDTRMKKITFFAPKYENFLSRISDDLDSIKKEKNKTIEIKYDDSLIKQLANLCVKQDKAWRGWGNIREQIEGIISRAISDGKSKLILNYDEILNIVVGNSSIAKT